jgi:hypothetical protein
MAEASHRLSIFLCHSIGDKQAVRDLYRRLRDDGFDPWLDEENLLPGQDWQQEISRAVEAADVVLVCLSRGSVGKRGYVQWEIKYALDVADRHPDGTIFLIPLRLEECRIPQRLERKQWVNLYEAKGYERLRSALRHRAESISVNPHADEPQDGEAGRVESAPRSTKALTGRSLFPKTNRKRLPIKLLTAAASLFLIAVIYGSRNRLIAVWEGPRPNPVREEPRPCPRSAEVGKQYYEAEAAILSGGARRDTEHPGFSGYGFVSGYGIVPLAITALDPSGPSTTFLVDVPSDGQYQVELCYGNGNTDKRALTISVNGESVRRTILPNATDKWYVWHTSAETLPLKAGRNAVSYRKSDNSDGGVNLDFIAVARERPAAPTPTPVPSPTARKRGEQKKPPPGRTPCNAKERIRRPC